VAPLPTGESEDTNRLVERFGEAILAAGLHHGQQVVYVKPEQLVALAELLPRNDPNLRYEALSTSPRSIARSCLCRPSDSRFHTVYQLRSYARKQHLMVVCPLDEQRRAGSAQPGRRPQGAIWPEREVWDSDGRALCRPPRPPPHPDAGALAQPPAAKASACGRRGSALHADLGRPGVRVLWQAGHGRGEPAAGAAAGHEPREHDHQHGAAPPSTHGVLRLVVELDGETVVNVDPDLGYLHSGFEKTGENKRYKDFVYYTDRMDYLSAMSNNFGYCLTVEKLLGVEIPERAQVLRVMMAELQRMASHLFWLSTHVLDVSGTGMALLMYATRERERILDLFEMVCGARLTVGYMRVGGVSRDIPPAFLGHLEEFLKAMPLRASTNTKRC
jgi:NADH:ubiquinone oxidoreductase subunit C